MTKIDLLLPPEETPYEKAHLAAQVKAWPLDVDAIRREGDPFSCTPDKLPFLAFDKGLVLWRDSWSDARKRGYVKNGWTYKLLEGTPLGVEAYLNLADGFLLDEALPPGRLFAVDDTGLSTQQVDDLMPQLRLYHHWPDKDFSLEYAFADRTCADAGFAVDDQAYVLPRYPVFWDRGISTPLTVTRVAETVISLSYDAIAVNGSAIFADAAYADARSFLGVTGNILGAVDSSQSILVTQPISADLEDPGWETLRESPDMRAAQAVADERFADATYATDDLGDIGTYDRLYLYDPSRLPTTLGAARIAAFADANICEIPPYLEILTAAIPGTPAAIPQRWFYADQAYALDESDLSNLDFAMTAINAGRRAGDRILVGLAPTMSGAVAASLPTLQDLS